MLCFLSTFTLLVLCIIFYNNNIVSIEFLFSGIKNNDGETPLDIAKEKKLTGIVNLLKSSNNRPPRGQFGMIISILYAKLLVSLTIF